MEHRAEEIRTNFLHVHAWKEFMAENGEREREQKFATEAMIIC